MSNKFNLDVGVYSLEDLKKLFTITDTTSSSPQELDIKISRILVNAKDSFNEFEINNFREFLMQAKLKYLNLLDYYNVKYDDFYPVTDELKTKLVNNKFLAKNEHVVIEKPKDIPQKTKNVSIYTASRDKKKWPKANDFEIDLPQDLVDVTSAQLLDYNMSFRVLNISESYQNSKFSFYLPNITDKKFTVVFEDGQYPNNFVSVMLAEFMNQAVQKTLGNNFNGVDYSTYSNFYSHYQPISGQFLIYNKNINDVSKSDKFILPFDEPEEYDCNTKINQGNIIAYDLPDYWGLGYYMGFNKQPYVSAYGTTSKTTVDPPGVDMIIAQYIESPGTFDIKQDGIAYLEIDNLNHDDQTSYYGGKVNSYFSRIPILYTGYEQDFGGIEPPIAVDLERIKKLRIKLRHFTGILIEVNNLDWDITIQFTCKK